MKLGPKSLAARGPKAKPLPKLSRCRICMHETEALTKGMCTDRAACEDRQPALFEVAKEGTA